MYGLLYDRYGLVKKGEEINLEISEEQYEKNEKLNNPTGKKIVKDLIKNTTVVSIGEHKEFWLPFIFRLGPNAQVWLMEWIIEGFEETFDDQADTIIDTFLGHATYFGEGRFVLALNN